MVTCWTNQGSNPGKGKSFFRFSGIKQLLCGDDHSLPPSAKNKNDQSYTSTPRVFLHVVDMNNFTVCVRAIIIFALYYVPYF